MSKHTLAYLAENVLVGYGNKAWHFNGADANSVANHYDGPIPAADVRSKIFNWDAVSEPIMVRGQEVPGKQAVVHHNTGHVFGIFSDGYEIHQHQDAILGSVERVLGTDTGIESAGQVDFGGMAWVSVSRADTTAIIEGVEFMTSILFFGSHTGKLATGAKLTNILSVCDNTVSGALSQKTDRGYRIKHTKNSGLRIESAQQALGMIEQGADAFAAQVADLVQSTVTDLQWAKFLDTYVPIEKDAKPGRALTMAENKRDSLAALYNNSPMVAPWKGTRFGVVQAVNTWFHHESIVRGQTRMEKNLLASITGKIEELDSETLRVLDLVMSN